MTPIISGFWIFLPKNPKIIKQVFSVSFKDFYMIFLQKKAENPYFTNQKFFTFPTSFLPPFSYIQVEVFSINIKKERRMYDIYGPKYGIKN